VTPGVIDAGGAPLNCDYLRELSKNRNGAIRKIRNPAEDDS
jgi:hypothetical protein